MITRIWKSIQICWKKYCDFVKEAGLDEGNCRRCVPMIKHDPPLEKKDKNSGKVRDDRLEA